MNNLLPLIIVCCASAIAICSPHLTVSILKPFRWLMRRFSDSVTRGVLFFFCLTLLLELGIGLCIRIPAPMVHDEFAYLLAADTFASGKLTNPTHPQWEHFESFHIIHQPTYQAKYPPAQGLLLALGQATTGYPIVGAWLGMAAACAAIFWMLCGWVPRRWAVYGGFLAALNASFLTGWGLSYWGGQVALLGGALLFGALPRLKQTPRSSTSLALAMGLVLLANSRPYEGLLAAIPVALVLLTWLIGRNSPGWRVALLRCVLPLLLVLLPAFLWMGYYNLRVTGNALKFPYQVWIEQYWPHSLDGILVSSEETPDTEKQFRTIYSYDLDTSPANQLIQHEFASTRFSLPVKLLKFDLVYTGSYMVGLICLLGAGALFRNRANLFAVGTSALVIAGVLVQDTSGHPHYLAPIGCLLILLQVQCLRYVAVWKHHWRPVGSTLIATVLLLTALTTTASAASGALPTAVAEFHQWARARQQILERLQSTPGKHLVLVNYHQNHSVHKEWIYNRADIDGAKVVWARVLEPDKNQQLLDYFKDRTIWIVNGDAASPELQHYSDRPHHKEQKEQPPR